MRSKGIAVVITVVLLVIISGCSRKVLPISEVNYLSGESGTITMRAIGYGANQQEAISYAGKSAINVLLFRGLGNSEQKMALVGTSEKEELAKHKRYFEQFYEQKRYSTFIMSSIPVSNYSRQKGGAKGVAVDIKVNLAALRKDLEQNNIIRKFGF